MFRPAKASSLAARRSAPQRIARNVAARATVPHVGPAMRKAPVNRLVSSAAPLVAIQRLNSVVAMSASLLDSVARVRPIAQKA